jgi:hypothetical protein
MVRGDNVATSFNRPLQSRALHKKHAMQKTETLSKVEQRKVNFSVCCSLSLHDADFVVGGLVRNRNQVCDRWARLQETVQRLHQQFGELQTLRNQVQRVEMAERRRTPYHCRKRAVGGTEPLRDSGRLRGGQAVPQS